MVLGTVQLPALYSRQDGDLTRIPTVLSARVTGWMKTPGPMGAPELLDCVASPTHASNEGADSVKEPESDNKPV